MDNRLPDGYGPDCRGKDEAISVRGSFDCLNGFWALLRSVVDPSRVSWRYYVVALLEPTTFLFMLLGFKNS